MSRRLRSQITWEPQKAPRGGEHLKALVAGAPTERPKFKTPVAPRERAIALLHMGSEVEHALMVQYLYAAYSLDDAQPDDARRALVARWRATVAEIAREEMGHLATVQNILTLIGGPLCFERDDYPIIDREFWPFPFELEPLTKDSLAKYVLAEMPSDKVLAKLHLTDEIKAIKLRLKCDHEPSVNRVGALYAAILELFTEGPMVQGPTMPPPAVTPYPFVAAVDIQADSQPFQVSPSAWGLGQKQVLIETAFDRDSALSALTKVSQQGEGPITLGPDTEAQFEGSHFKRFLDIYREFPEASAWRPARPVAVNPTTREDAPTERRIEGEALCWAALANLRYRMLLLYLKHSFYIETPFAHPTRSPRAALVSWAFGEMYNLRSLSEILMKLPFRPGSATVAGPPFEMPYTLSLPTRGAGRWRTHRDLVTASIELIDGMLVRGAPHERYLRGYATRTSPRESSSKS